LIYGAFTNLVLSENGDKKMEALKKIDTHFRGESTVALPDVKPVNER
jgi:hypothetical protein